MSLLRAHPRKTRFTVFEIDAQTAAEWGGPCCAGRKAEAS